MNITAVLQTEFFYTLFQGERINMLENTISIDNETALENGNVQQADAVLFGEDAVLKTA